MTFYDLFTFIEAEVDINTALQYVNTSFPQPLKVHVSCLRDGVATVQPWRPFLVELYLCLGEQSLLWPYWDQAKRICLWPTEIY